MSFNPHDMISQSNYEEYFVLYMDDELDAEGKRMVEDFIASHPHLQAELDLLLGTKLPAEEFSFAGKEELFSGAMKLNAVDEDLLLYIDNELAPAGRKAVEEKIAAGGDAALQFALLQKTKLDAGDVIPYPNKEELYHRTERVVAFTIWMRVAAAIVLLLSGSLFFLLNKERGGDTTPSIASNPPAITKPAKEAVVPKPADQLLKTTAPTDATASVQPEKKATQVTLSSGATTVGNRVRVQTASSVNDAIADKNSPRERDVIRVDVRRLVDAPSPKAVVVLPVNKTIATGNVTPRIPDTYNSQNIPSNNPEVDWAVETEKKAPARGFFRKVSRFIERKTGIGTANADDELLIGAVALKLK